MMRKGWILAGLAVCLSMLSACSGSGQEANEDNFTAALNEYLRQEGICISIAQKLPIQIELERINKPANYEEPLKRTPRTETREKYDWLEKIGMLTSSDVIIERKDDTFWSRSKEPPKYKARQYDLTDKGKALLIDPDQTNRSYRIKIGTAKVDKIKSFTSPTPKDGYTISRVQYTYSPADVAKVFKDPKIEALFPELKTKLKKGQTDTAIMVLMNTGWQHGKVLLDMVRRPQ